MPTETNIRPLLISSDAALAVLGLKSPTSLRKLEREGKIEVRWLGKRKMIVVASLDALVAGLPNGEPAYISEKAAQMKAARAGNERTEVRGM